MAFEIRGEVPQLIDAVFDAERPSGVFETEADTGPMLNAHDALETQLIRPTRKPRDPNMIAERILQEAQAPRLRANL